MPAKKKAGTAEIKTRAARRQIIPAIQPGSLTSSADGRENMQRRRLLNSLQSVCKHYSNEKIPDFSANTAKLDGYLQGSLNDERTGFLSAFVDQASMIQSNLHYRLVGSKSLVQRSLDLLHASEGGEGFRKLIKMTALNFYSSNFGGAVYLDRTDPVVASYLPDSNKWYWSTPPVQAMYATDSTLFSPNGDYVYPFTYDGEYWSRYDFFRVVSMPSTILKTWGVGRCPLYRCIQIARMTSATYEHVHSTLSPDSAKGLLTIQGLSADEFIAAMSGSDAVNEEDAVQKNGFTVGDALGDIVVLADRDDEIKVKFVTLSRIPDGFFIDQWIRWTLTSFATNLGFPLEEFIGMPSNTLLGQSGATVEQNAQRGSTKGGSEFRNSFQDNIQSYAMPDSVLFQFAERDESSELIDLSIREKKVKIVTDLFTSTQLAIINKSDQSQDSLIEARAAGEHIINKEEARLLLDAWDALPFKLTSTVNADVIIDDTIYDLSQNRLRDMREKVRDTQQIKRLAARPAGEPVIAHDSYVDKASGFLQERETVLWEDDAELGRKTNWQGVSFIDGVYDLAGPGAYKRRLPGKTITVELAIDSDHASEVARLFRKLMVAQAQGLSEELSLEKIGRAQELASKKDSEALISRLYALTQLGRDGKLGRRKLADAVSAEIASMNLAYAKDRTEKLLGSVLGRSVSKEVEMLLIEYAPNPAAEFVLDPRIEILPALEERLRVLARELATTEAGLAFEAGGKNAIVALGEREK